MTHIWGIVLRQMITVTVRKRQSTVQFHWACSLTVSEGVNRGTQTRLDQRRAGQTGGSASTIFRAFLRAKDDKFGMQFACHKICFATQISEAEQTRCYRKRQSKRVKAINKRVNQSINHHTKICIMKIQFIIKDKEVMDASETTEKTALVVEERFPRLLSWDELSVDSASASPKWSAAYDPKPIVSQSSILLIGFILFILATIWPPLLLLVAYIASKLVPYSFRVNDDPAVRRRLFAEFASQAEDLPEAFKQPPKHLDVQHGYWTNKRYVRMDVAWHAMMK